MRTVARVLLFGSGRKIFTSIFSSVEEGTWVNGFLNLSSASGAASGCSSEPSSGFLYPPPEIPPDFDDEDHFVPS